MQHMASQWGLQLIFRMHNSDMIGNTLFFENEQERE
jgi:hypothetical protein